ncbi:MAG TPA: NAD(P)-dependent oxidoreductase [Opitutaceae bacterium]|nr:NAD(P)-dependent oxidoreductase [Opitutaceae bacterium]
MTSNAPHGNALTELPCAPEAIDEFLSRPPSEVIESMARVKGPVVVLGAGGKMGLHLSAMAQRALSASGGGGQVTAVSRFSSLRDRDEFTALGVKTLACDLGDSQALAGLPDAALVIFMAGAKFGTARAPELLRRTNVEIPRQVAERYRSARIVAFSTGCVYPFVTPDSGGASEATPLDPAPGDYAASCIERERAFAEAAQRHGTPVALVRLNYSVEFRYGILVDIALKVLRGEPLDVSMGYVNVIWQPDAIAHSLRTWELARSPAEPINVTGAEILSVRALAEEFGRLLDRPVIVEGREAPTAWLNDSSRSHRLFGPPPTSVADMQRWIAAWLRQGGSTWDKPTGFERRDGKF